MTSTVPPPRPLRLSIAALLVACMWALLLAGWIADIQSFLWFLLSTAGQFLATVGFLIWWLTRKRLPWSERLIAPACAIAFGVLVGIATIHVIKPIVFLITLGLPCVLAACVIWLAFAANWQPKPRLRGLILCFAAVWSLFFLIRINNLSGNLRADIHWRWTPTGEELFLAQSARLTPTTQLAAAPLVLRQGDWPAFRGPQRDSRVHGLKIALDWNASPPKVLWRQRVGPAWSSMAIVDGRLFTQEQRADKETVVCRDALTGAELWTHADPARFDEAVSGTGPRATPAFADGRLYTQGATGKLNCLDAATGKLIWSRDDAVDSGAKLPIWGFSSSPLADDGKVFVYTAGDSKSGLLAYPAEGGAPIWKADTGNIGYSSPQLATIAGQKSILIITDSGLFAVDEITGKLQSHFAISQSTGIPPVAQPCRISDDTFVLGHGAGFGAASVQLPQGAATPTTQWISRQLKPSFSDLVFYQGCLYGFDGTVFCCVDASTGKRNWREGRYGAGQVLLLADQGVMIVTTESGDAILLRCNPQAHEELASIPAVTGKTWNHPALAQNHLFIRSDAEMTCLELKPQ